MKDSFGGRLADLVTNPRRLMDNLGRRPTWWQPGLLLLGITVAASWLTLPITKAEQIELTRDSFLMRLAGEAATQEQYEQALDLGASARLIEAASTGFGVWIAVILAGLVLGFFARMADGQGTRKQAIAIVSWAALLGSGLGALLKLPLVLATESVFQVNLGLAALLPDGDPGTALFKVLMIYGDFPTWWTLVVTVIGFERIFGLRRSSAVLTVVLPWALVSLVQLGLLLLAM